MTINIKNTYFGFTDNMKAMQKAKVENTLDNKVRSEGVIMTEKEWVYNHLLLGYTPKLEKDCSYYSRKLQDYTKPKDEYSLYLNGSSYTINKTFFDFGNFIISNGFLDANKANEYITAEQVRIEEENKIAAEKLAKEKADKEEEKNRYELGKQVKKVERLTNMQITILALTVEELSRIDKILDYLLTEYSDIYKDGENKPTETMVYYDIARFVALGKMYPEATIDSIKGYRDIISPDTKSPNKGNTWYIRDYKMNNDIRNMFFGITDNMSTQMIRSILTGEITADEAQNRIEKAEQAKQRQAEKMKTFYRLTRDKGFIEEQGEQIKISEFTVYGAIVGTQFMLIEEKTGLSLGSGKNKTEAIHKVNDAIEKNGLEKVKKIIEDNLIKNGVSPLVQTV